MSRKFYKTVIQVEVLSEEPYDPHNLAQVSHDIIEGDCSGVWKVTATEELGGKAAAEALIEQGSEPGFFMLDDNGNEIDC